MKPIEDIYEEWPYNIRYLNKICWDKIEEYIKKYKITSALEFGSGLSTILFNNMGLDVVSYETDPVYLRIIKSYNLANVEFRLWDNFTTDIEGHFGISLVDGILPRTNQLYYAQKHSRYIAIDDFNDDNSNMGLAPMLKGYTRLDDQSIRLAIFRKIKQ